MKAIDYLKTFYPDINENDKQGLINGYFWNGIAELMEDYALKAWMAGENNGRKRLSSEGELDKNGSKNDFENWKAGLLS